MLRGSLFVCLVSLVHLVCLVHLVFFGVPISQLNERDKLNKPNTRNEPVWSLPTAAAPKLKDADPAAEPLHMISWLLDTSVLHYGSGVCYRSPARQ